MKKVFSVFVLLFSMTTISSLANAGGGDIGSGQVQLLNCEGATDACAEVCKGSSWDSKKAPGIAETCASCKAGANLILSGYSLDKVIEICQHDAIERNSSNAYALACVAGASRNANFCAYLASLK